MLEKVFGKRIPPTAMSPPDESHKAVVTAKPAPIIGAAVAAAKPHTIPAVIARFLPVNL